MKTPTRVPPSVLGNEVTGIRRSALRGESVSVTESEGTLRLRART